MAIRLPSTLLKVRPRHKILKWLKREINDAWENRDRITLSYEGTPKPGLIEILKLLPRTNCRECGQPTCMVFAARVAEGAKGTDGCAALSADCAERLREYMGQFHFEV